MLLPRKRIARVPRGSGIQIHPCHTPELSEEERRSRMFMGLPLVISSTVPEDEVHLVSIYGVTTVMPVMTTLDEMEESVIQSELKMKKKSDKGGS